ncbi:helix-turn-helix transcriptional regulator [Streptomyces sp. N2-109]|uniref:Helix-turn-helix transcriptional regulator n=1 Tax=Streptomyces gossypii TaxID=2883101 RepID=A0ABT2K1V3_9ACTN|nr:helix-turn-helix transcriptional regulator [Streptomyces gossypii]MCT2593883.1 helix-turn-helix transcriptional regulator [Streptomyces gossypii]
MNVHSELEQRLRTGPFPLALRAAIEARGLALHRIQRRLAQQGIQVGVTSLSYWQQGTRRPVRAESLRAVRALEEVLDLPPDALIRLLAPPPGAERPPARPYRSLLDASGPLYQLFDALGTPADGGLHTISHFERVRVGASRELVGRDSQQVVRAHRDGVDRYVAIHYGDPGCAPARVGLRGMENCRAGRVRRHEEAGIVVAELLFDTRLRSGDTHVFGYSFEDGTGPACREYVRGFSFGGGQYLLQVRFDEAALPVQCRGFTRTTPGARPTGQRELTLTGRHRMVHLAEQSAGPGLLGIGWDWA